LRIYGVDFTCAPRRAKPITVAVGVLGKNVLMLEAIRRLPSFPEFEAMLARPGPWVGGFDFPFSLPRELGRDLGWPAAWPELVAHCAAMSRHELRNILDAYRATRPVGKKYAHRATDLPAGSSSPMKLVNPPVALMFHEGAPRVLASGAHVPALSEGDRSRVALEAYPGLLVFGGGPQTMTVVDNVLNRNFRAEAEKRGYIVIAPAAPDDQLFFEAGFSRRRPLGCRGGRGFRFRLIGHLLVFLVLHRKNS